MENDSKLSENEIVPQPENACETLDEVIQSRRKFRSLLFHVLYAIDALDYEVSAKDVTAKLNREYETNVDLDGILVKTVSSIAQQRINLDEAFIPYLKNWKFERIGKCTLLVLRYAIWEIFNTDTPHNIILNFWLEIGLLGLVAFGMIFAKFFKQTKVKLLQQKSWLTLGIAAAMITILVHGLIDVPYFKNDLAILFWIIIGLL